MAETILHLGAGSIGGACGIAAGQPFDTVKVKLQTQASGAQAKYRGPLHCAISIARAEGLRGFFRGVTSPVLANAPINAILFAVEHRALRFFQTWSHAAGWGEGQQQFAAGATSGLSQAPLACLAERVKILLQVDTTLRGPVAAARAVVAAGGLGALFSGFTLTLARDVPAFGVYFSTYHAIKRAMGEGGEAGPDASSAAQESLPPGKETLSPWQLMVAGGCAGTASWLLLHPVDVLKSTVQAHMPAPGSVRPPGGALGVLRGALQREGPRWLLRGIIPTCARAFPASAVTFLVYEALVEQGNKALDIGPPPPHVDWDLPRE